MPCYGHNSFFKNNYLFRSWTDASSIVDYLIFLPVNILPSAKSVMALMK
ncbi:SpoVR family protein [Escherichia coli]